MTGRRPLRADTPIAFRGTPCPASGDVTEASKRGGLGEAGAISPEGVGNERQAASVFSTDASKGAAQDAPGYVHFTQVGTARNPASAFHADAAPES